MMHQKPKNQHSGHVSRRHAAHMVSLVWHFTESNFSTFIVPNTAFGLLGALSGLCLVPDSTTRPDQNDWFILGLSILKRLPLSVLFNWCFTLVFDLSNQRGRESVEEDRLNKPWRPIPTGRATADEARRAILIVAPVALALSYYLQVWTQGTMILVLNWLYNDVKGGDGLLRDPIISVAFSMFNSASVQITSGGKLSELGIAWTSMISGVILTTMQVQDLKDQAGDQIRGRRTMPLIAGDHVSRLSIAVLTAFWTGACGYFWNLNLYFYPIPAFLALVVGWRVISIRTAEGDARTWRWWCVWTVALYSFPVCRLI